VRAYVCGGTPAVRDWLDRRQVRASHCVVDRMHRVVETANAETPAAETPAAAAPAAVPPAAVAPAAVAPAAAPSATVLALADLDLAQLAGADPDTVRRVLRTLTARRALPPDARRAEARELLVRDRAWEQRLRAALPPAQAREAVDAVVRCAFAPADGRADEAVRDLEWLVATLDTSSMVLDSLVGLVVEHGEHAILLEAAGLRWLRERGHPVAGAAVPPPGRQRSQQRSDHTYLHLLHQGRTAASSRSRASRDV